MEISERDHRTSIADRFISSPAPAASAETARGRRGSRIAIRIPKNRVAKPMRFQLPLHPLAPFDSAQGARGIEGSMGFAGSCGTRSSNAHSGSLHSIPRVRPWAPKLQRRRPGGGTTRGWRGSSNAIRQPKIDVMHVPSCSHELYPDAQGSNTGLTFGWCPPTCSEPRKASGSPKGP